MTAGAPRARASLVASLTSWAAFPARLSSGFDRRSPPGPSRAPRRIKHERCFGTWCGRGRTCAVGRPDHDSGRGDRRARGQPLLCATARAFHCAGDRHRRGPGRIGRQCHADRLRHRPVLPGVARRPRGKQAARADPAGFDDPGAPGCRPRHRVRRVLHRLDDGRHLLGRGPDPAAVHGASRAGGATRTHRRQRHGGCSHRHHAGQAVVALRCFRARMARRVSAVGRPDGGHRGEPRLDDAASQAPGRDELRPGHRLDGAPRARAARRALACQLPGPHVRGLQICSGLRPP